MSDRNGAVGVARRGGRVAPLLLSAVCAGYAAGSVLGWGSRPLSLVMGDFTPGAAAVTAAAACLRQGRSHDGRSRPAWLLFALSFTVAALGHLVSGWYETAPGAGTAGPAPAGPCASHRPPPRASSWPNRP